MSQEENSNINEAKTLVDDLKVGMYVSNLDKDWTESSFLFQGFLIEEQQQIEELKQECNYVYIEIKAKEFVIEEKTQPSPSKSPSVTKKAVFSLDGGKLFHKKPSVPEPINKQPQREHTFHLNDIIQHKVETQTIEQPSKTTSFSNEMGKAKQSHSKTQTVVKDTLSDIKKGGSIDASAVEDAVQDCMKSMLRTPDAMMLTMNLKDKHFSSWQHSMNASVLAVDLGRYLNLEDDELITLGLCGMFHDIGNTLISKKELDKAGDKREFIRSHTTLGHDLLAKSDGQLGTVVAQVALSHHENLDGSGFPHGLSGDQISAYTRMISIVSFYDTLTCDKKNKKGLSHYEAMVQLLKKADANHFDKTLVDSFNQCIGTYPVGSTVEMNTGEIAVVVEENAKQRLKPIVMLITTVDKQPCSEKVLVNLAKPKFNGKDNSYTIKNIIHSGEYQIEQF